MRLLLIFISAASMLVACADQPVSKSLSISGQTMGTTYSITYQPIPDGPERHLLSGEIETILAEINQSMSTYSDDSELSRFNQADTGADIALSKELFQVINHAVGISQLTGGAFDITVGPLVNLWGFGPEPVQRQLPSETELLMLMQYTGYEKLHIESGNRIVTKSIDNMYVDLSGIAKGYAVDRLAQHMDTHDIQHYLIDIGGELLGKGLNDSNKPWQIGIEQARPLSRDIQRIVSLNNNAMATSGDYRNYYERDGVRYSHTIDPQTGKPITHALASVTVLHESCMHADAMATAFMIMGPDATLELANQQQLPVYLIVKSENGFVERYNDLFSAYLSK